MKVGYLVKCNQCGVQMGSGGGPKCSNCKKLNNNFTSMYNRGYFAKEPLSAKCAAVIESMRLIVDTNFEGNLLEANIPLKAKVFLIDKGFYPEYKQAIEILRKKSFSINSLERLEEYQKIFNANNSKETL